jgi:hypothetical protein
MISAAFPYQKQRRRVLGREMAYDAMVLRDNFFIEQVLPQAILRTLRRGDGRVPTAVRQAWRGATADADVAPGDPYRR